MTADDTRVVVGVIFFFGGCGLCRRESYLSFLSRQSGELGRAGVREGPVYFSAVW